MPGIFLHASNHQNLILTSEFSNMFGLILISLQGQITSNETTDTLRRYSYFF